MEISAYADQFGWEYTRNILNKQIKHYKDYKLIPNINNL